MVMFLLSFVKGSKSAEGGPNPLADMDPGGPNPLGHRPKYSNQSTISHAPVWSGFDLDSTQAFRFARGQMFSIWRTW